MTRERLGPLVLLVFALTVIAAGCGDDDHGEAEPAATNGAQTDTGSGVEAQFEETDIPAKIVGMYRFEIPGDAFWIAQLDADGEFIQRLNGRLLDAKGEYGVRGDEILVRDTASGVGTFCEGVGTYRWELDGNRLVMREVDEPCSGREDLWTTGWTKLDNSQALRPTRGRIAAGLPE